MAGDGGFLSSLFRLARLTAQSTGLPEPTRSAEFRVEGARNTKLTWNVVMRAVRENGWQPCDVFSNMHTHVKRLGNGFAISADIYVLDSQDQYRVVTGADGGSAWDHAEVTLFFTPSVLMRLDSYAYNQHVDRLLLDIENSLRRSGLACSRKS